MPLVATVTRIVVVGPRTPSTMTVFTVVVGIFSCNFQTTIIVNIFCVRVLLLGRGKYFISNHIKYERLILGMYCRDIRTLESFHMPHQCIVGFISIVQIESVNEIFSISHKRYSSHASLTSDLYIYIIPFVRAKRCKYISSQR